MARVISISKRWRHHTTSGGYDRLLDFIDGDAIGRVEGSNLVLRLARKAHWHCSRHNKTTLDYHFGDWCAEWKVLLSSRVRSFDVCHALYGEEQLSLILAKRQWLKAKLMATFHLPASRLYELPPHWQNNIEQVDVGICVARDQIGTYSERIQSDRVAFVPHGIDVDVFCPEHDSRRESEQLELLTVGWHMRDITLLHRVADLCKNEGVPVRFRVICPASQGGYFTGCDNVELVHDVSEDDLITANRECDAIFLPLTDATANNALLEGLACGTPAIVTDLPAIRDYVGENAAVFLNRGDSDQAFEVIRDIAQAPNTLNEKRLAARQTAELFSWQNVSTAILQCHSAIANDTDLPEWKHIVNNEPPQLHAETLK